MAAALANVNTEFWCERVRLCFSMFVKSPHTLQHMLLFGPPGSGKTTSAAWLIDQIWGTRKGLMSMSMNAADERSLESIRQKVFPFLRVDWRVSAGGSAPRFLILDECETLTEAAQLSLQTILDMNPKDICIILICNSQSRIHPKLRQRLLRIRYDPPRLASAPSGINAILRGDLRTIDRSQSIEKRTWQLLNAHPSTLPGVLKDETTDMQGILTEILILSYTLGIIDMKLLASINAVYPLLTDGTILYQEIEDIIIGIIMHFRDLAAGR
jgi:DNA polymerase III delta prime subunit